jgi:hypothetical protein
VIAIGSFSGGMSARTQDAEYCVRTIHQRRQDAIPPFQVVSHQCVAHSGSLKDILQKAEFSASRQFSTAAGVFPISCRSFAAAVHSLSLDRPLDSRVVHTCGAPMAVVRLESGQSPPLERQWTRAPAAPAWVGNCGQALSLRRPELFEPVRAVHRARAMTHGQPIFIFSCRNRKFEQIRTSGRCKSFLHQPLRNGRLGRPFA